jgi:hypothetical protein
LRWFSPKLAVLHPPLIGGDPSIADHAIKNAHRPKKI